MARQRLSVVPFSLGRYATLLPRLAELNRGVGWVYAVREDGTPLIKIGYSANLPARVRQLRVQFHVPLTLLASVHVTSYVTKVERWIYTHLDTQRIEREWFYISMDQEILVALVHQAHYAIVEQYWLEAQNQHRRSHYAF